MNYHHWPRPEDWPVQPVVYAGFHWMPDGFFDENPTMDISCRYVFAHSQKAIKVWGPVPGVVDQIAKLHQDFWPG